MEKDLKTLERIKGLKANLDELSAEQDYNEEEVINIIQSDSETILPQKPVTFIEAMKAFKPSLTDYFDHSTELLNAIGGSTDLNILYSKYSTEADYILLAYNTLTNPHEFIERSTVLKHQDEDIRLDIARAW